MEKTFRAILSEFLEEKSVSEPVFPSETAPELAFLWQSPLAKSAPKSAYASAARQAAASFVKTDVEAEARPAQPEPPPEKLIPAACLSAADREMTQILIQLGAEELKDGLSERRLKKAHRRLAKRLHPDALPSNAAPSQRDRSQQMFLKLQSAYERLKRSLSQY